MRKLIIIIALALVSCEDRRCEERREQIEAHYYELIDQALENESYVQAELLLRGMNRELREACE